MYIFIQCYFWNQRVQSPESALWKPSSRPTAGTDAPCLRTWNIGMRRSPSRRSRTSVGRIKAAGFLEKQKQSKQVCFKLGYTSTMAMLFGEYDDDPVDLGIPYFQIKPNHRISPNLWRTLSWIVLWIWTGRISTSPYSRSSTDSMRLSKSWASCAMNWNHTIQRSWRTRHQLGWVLSKTKMEKSVCKFTAKIQETRLGVLDAKLKKGCLLGFADSFCGSRQSRLWMPCSAKQSSSWRLFLALAVNNYSLARELWRRLREMKYDIALKMSKDNEISMPENLCMYVYIYICKMYINIFIYI